MQIKQDLASIVTVDRVSDDPEVIDRYSRDHSLVQPRRAACVAWAQNTGEVQAIVRYAASRSIPITPRSSSVSFYGGGIPEQGGILLDLTSMNRILDVHPGDRRIRVEAGASWAQVQEELGKQGMMVCGPLLPHPARSVVTGAMQREPMLIPKSEYGEVFLSGEFVTASGGLFYSGTAVGRSHVGQTSQEHFIPSNRLFMGAQGVYGIVTWANLKTEWLPTRDKVFFIAFDRVEDAVRPIYRIERRYLGSECLLLNSLNLAAILSEGDTRRFEDLRAALPPYVLVLALSAGNRFPEDKLAYEEDALMEIAIEFGFKPLLSAGGVPVSGQKLVASLRRPWGHAPYWRHVLKGSSHDVFFHTSLKRVPEFTAAIGGLATQRGYPIPDLGFYVQPIERARIAYCEFGFHCNHQDIHETERVRDLFLEASELAMNMGGVFTTPYGPWADMVYRRNAAYASVLKAVKESFDPNRILNPGKLGL